MNVTLNINNFVSSYAFIGKLGGGIEVTPPINLEHFENHFQAYKLENNELVFDEKKWVELTRQELLDALRRRREEECFPIINRGQLWYDNLTEEQKFELNVWYHDWLNVTETLIVPNKPEWLI